MTQAAAPAADEALLARFAPLFEPQSVAVVGASTKSATLANLFIRRIRDFGYGGAIYPIHPYAAEIEGLPACRDFAHTPQPVDYAYVAIPAAQVPALLAGAAGRLRYAHVISSGFGESAGGRTLEAQAVAASRAAGLRLIGPNCMGLYTPRGRITYTEVAAREVGNVGVVTQSGGLGTDVIRRGLVRGVKFSGLVSIGNGADLDCAELAEFYLADPQTRVVGLYIESSRRARRLFEILRAARAAKPVVILKGGRTPDGASAASSHTGSLAGDERAWDALAKQTGAILVQTLDEFIDVLLAFGCVTPRPSRPTARVALFGNGGGASVLGADAFARAGIRVPRFGDALLQALAGIELAPGTSVANPIDAPVGMMEQEEGRVAERILEAVYAGGYDDALVMHLSMPAFSGRTPPQVLDNLVMAALRVQSRHPQRGHFLLVLRSDGEPAIEARKREFRERANALGVPVYDELERAATALGAVGRYERFVAARKSGTDPD